MVRIVVNPEQLRQLAGQLQGAVGDLREVQGRLGGALSRLDWEARQRSGVEGRVSSARSQAGALANQVEGLAGYLRAKAQAFEEADGQGAQALGQVMGAYVAAQQPWLGRLGALLAPPDGVIARLLGLGTLLGGATIAGGAFVWTWVHQALAPDVSTQVPPAARAAVTVEGLEAAIRADRDNTAGRADNQCVSWARQRRVSLGGSAMPAISTSLGLLRQRYPNDPAILGAKHYLDYYADSAVETSRFLEHHTLPLDQWLTPGTAVVWDAYAAGARAAGHVAIVEAVEADRIWISESNWPEGSAPHVRCLDLADLARQGIYVVAPNATPRLDLQ